MELKKKLSILSDAAKYDAACTSSGVSRSGKKWNIGSSAACGICHSFSADGRCISLLKVLMSNVCAYDCAYCVNRRSNDTPRATFAPRELADLTMAFYRRNYIEGLFLSSAVVGTPDDTCVLMLKTLEILRNEYRFGGYIHTKAIPGADKSLLARLGMLSDRMSVNIELPSQESLKLLAPEKSKSGILKPMGAIKEMIDENRHDLVVYRHTPSFVPGGQSTQMIVGATPETDLKILRLASGLYNKYRLKRVFYSAYVPVVEASNLPALDVKPPLLREHRLYQADWLLRFYGFSADELLDEKHQNFNPLIDPKCDWALHHMDQFPVEINKAPYETLLRVPGIGVTGARKIIAARRTSRLDEISLRRIGISLKRAQYFILCNGRSPVNEFIPSDSIIKSLLSQKSVTEIESRQFEQLSLFDTTQEDLQKCLTGQM
ncbi:MAG: putative DNA modification/repair radical SAM protein [Clostridiales bacterium]|nr:putative DNA modification/repair radical SAM protein [Clostridiales bacterium]